MQAQVARPPLSDLAAPAALQSRMDLQDSLQDDVGAESVEELVAAPPRKLSRLRKAGDTAPPPPHENAQPNAALSEGPESEAPSEGGPEEAASPGGQRAESEDGEVRPASLRLAACARVWTGSAPRVAVARGLKGVSGWAAGGYRR